MAALPHFDARLDWLKRIATLMLTLVLILAIIEVPARQNWIANLLVAPVVDIRTPATLAAKVRLFAQSPAPRFVMIGDSLIAGRVMLEHGDASWRANTISADLERRLAARGSAGARVMNLGMDGLLPADMETMVDAILPTKPEVILIDISLRSFSKDFSEGAARHSREWLTPGLSFREDGKVRMLPDQLGPSKALERLALNYWATYRLRDAARARMLGGEPADRLESLKKRLASRRQATDLAAAEMRLLLQVRSRYESASLDSDNPQFAAWTRMISKLRAAGQHAVIFYAAENPRLLPGLMDPGRYEQMRRVLARSVTEGGDTVKFLAGAPQLSDEMYLDHVHVDAAGNRAYGEWLFRSIRTSGSRFSRSREPLTLSYQPFLEQVDEKRVLLGELTDFSNSTSTTLTPATPAFELNGMPVLSIEREGSEPLRDIIFLYHWWDKAGVPMGVRDSYHMLRATVMNFNEYPEAIKARLGEARAKKYVDVFAGVPSRRRASKVAFYLQDSSQRSPSQAKGSTLRLYGQGLLRSALPSTSTTIRNSKVEAEFSGQAPASNTVLFAPANGKSISGRGVSFELKNVATVYTINADHRLNAHTTAGEFEIGAMLPQVIGYLTKAGEYRALTVSGADLIRFSFKPDSGDLSLDVFEYEFRERTTRGSSILPDASGRRIHPNLGIVEALPAGELRIVHSITSTIAFPTLVPNGALAAVAFTEHADFVGVAQDMLTMYGDLIPKVVDGKGFLGNRIPLTKTIFPSGKPVPFRSRTASSSIVGDFSQSTVEQVPAFVSMLRAYKAGGHDVEIGIHCAGTPLAGPSTKSSADQRDTSFVASSLKLTKEFNPVTWVDHGGRECLWEAGWDRSSPHYIVDLLQEHGFRYINMLGDKYDGRVNMIADNEPSNLLFYSIGLDNKLGDDWKPIVFNTVPIGMTEKDFSNDHIRQIVKNRGLVNVHTYLPYEVTRFKLKSPDVPELEPNPWFNQLLGNLNAARQSGDVFLATTRDLNDYMWGVRGVLVFASLDAVTVVLSENKPLRGLTIATRSMESAEDTPLPIQGATVQKTRVLDGVTYRVIDVAPGEGSAPPR